MNSDFQYAGSRVVQEINELTVKTIDDLRELMLATFDSEACVRSISKLSEHVSTFYGEIVDEMKTRKEHIGMEVNKLKQEALDLKRLLKLDTALEPPRNVPLVTIRDTLNDNLEELRSELKTRNAQIHDLLVEQEALCDELEEEPRELLCDPLPSSEELREFREHLNALSAKRDLQYNQIQTLRKSIKQLRIDLDISFTEEQDIKLLEDPNLLPSKTNINKLKELHETLSRDMDDLRDSIDLLKVKLEKIWSMLELSSSSIKRFKSLTEYNQKTHTKLYNEFQKRESEKSHHIKKFVDKTREEIVLWWNKTLRSEVEKSRFANFTSDCYTDDLLTLHEMELADLKKFYYDNEKIFELYHQRRVIWERMETFENKANDPNRYNNRGGQLLKEEKERKMISKKLPEIEHQILQLLEDYENLNKKKFTVYGIPFDEIIRSDWIKKDEAKEITKSARKAHQTLTPLFKTPVPSRQNSTAKKFGSSSHIAVLSSAKRCILNELQVPTSARKVVKTPSKFLTPSRNATGINIKTPAKYTLPALPRRRSGRLSGKKNRRLSKGKKTKALDATVTSGDSVNYDCFKDYLEPRSPCRSSILVGGNKENRKRSLRRAHTTTIKTTPAKIQKTISGKSGTPSPGAYGRKLVATDLPILM